MATQIWEPKAATIAEVITVTIGGTLASETFQLKLGGVVIAEHTDADTVIATTVAALVAAWSASTNPWATAVTAVDASPNITLTAKVAGVPFGVHLNLTAADAGGQAAEAGVYGYYVIGLNTPGGGATLAQDETTANRGPNCANLGANWSIGNILADNDDVRIENGAIDILWGLNMGFTTPTSGNEIILDSLHVSRSYSGKIGLDSATFNGLTTAHEYRETYWRIRVTAADGDVRIGERIGPGLAAGSRRIMLDLKGDGANIIMFGSHSQAFDAGRPAVRILCDDASVVSTVLVRGAEGGFGIAMDKSSETSTVEKLHINCPSTKHRVFTGEGVTLKNGTPAFQITGGFCRLRHVASPDGTASIVAEGVATGGELWLEGDFKFATFKNAGALVYANNYSSDSGAGAAFDDYKGFAGTTDTTKSSRARTWTSIDHYGDHHKIIGSGEVVTFTNFNHKFGLPGGSGAAKGA